MKTYRFVTEAHFDVLAETLEAAIQAFKEMKQKGLPPEVGEVSRIEVKDKKGEYVPVDYPLRAAYPVANTVGEIGLSP